MPSLRPPQLPPHPEAARSQNRPGGAARLIVVGRGRLGRSLVSALTATGAQVASSGARTWRQDLPPLLGGDTARRILFLAVPDQHLGGLASRLDLGPRPPEEIAVVHLSGNLGLTPLGPLAAGGHQVGSFHPLQAFAGERGREAFQGILVAVDATTPALLSQLEDLARSLGAHPRQVTDAQRTLYHAAAVLAATDLVALAGQAAAVLAANGWTRQAALEDLVPLMEGVLANVRALGLPTALTGPIRRGDPDAVRQHLAALAGGHPPGPASPGEAGLAPRVYRILGLAALELAVESGLEPESAALMRAALTE